MKEHTGYPFLNGGGEMGQLTRKHNWAVTPVGPIEQWPVSLRSTLGIILHSEFPMLLFWGDDLIAFYNDAYIKTLQSKHPVLGSKASDIWPEGWETVQPMLQQVYNSGQTVSFKDLLIPIERNNTIENIYWTFSYSPAYGDDGEIAGVYITCSETTDKIINISELQESRAELHFAIDAAELGTWELNPAKFTFRANARLKEWFGVKPDDEVLLSDATNVIVESDRERVVNAINYSLQYESGGKYDIEYTIVSPITNIERTVRAKGRTRFGEDKKAYMFNGTLQDVTQQAIDRKKIEDSEAKFRALIEQAPVGTCLFTGPDLTIELANNTMIGYWGKGDSVIGKPLLEALPELEGQSFPDKLLHIYNTGETIEESAAAVDLAVNGVLKTYYFDYTYKPIFDSDGKVYGIMDMAVDVTEQVEAVNRLKESEQQVRAIIDSAPFPIGVYVGREMRVMLANQSIMDVWDKGNDIVGKTYFELLPELENQEIYPQLLQVYDTGTPFHARNERVDIVVDGRLQSFYFNYSFTPLFDAAGKVYGVMNTAAEVTDLNVAKQKVEQSEQNFRNMIVQAPVAMCIMLGPGHVVDIANELMIELWGKPAKDVLNKPIFEGLPDARDQGLEELLENAYTKGQTFEAYERPVELVRNGRTEVVYQNFVYQPYKDASGTILGVLAVTIDVTAQVLARRKIEEIVKERTAELETANSSLHKSNNELAQFAYIASHDLQEPIRKISIFAQMLDTRIHNNLDSGSLNYLTKIRNSADRMQALIRDVLTYSELVKEANIYEHVDLNDIASGTITDYELLIEQKHATVTFNSLPVVEAIPLQMSQLFGNMVSNSLKYSRPGIDPVITITASALGNAEKQASGYEGDYYKIEFQDNGIGFEQEYAERIFNIFQRLHGKTEFSGTGIGLAICKKIVQNHHGNIWASATEGKGAKFTVLLPAKQISE